MNTCIERKELTAAQFNILDHKLPGVAQELTDLSQVIRTSGLEALRQ
jgi:hypothetical protein